MSSEGFIMIPRSFTEWDGYKNESIKAVYLHCLLKANDQEGMFDGKVIPRGSFVSSYGHLAEETGLSVKRVRTAIGALKRARLVASSSTPKYSVFTVLSYDFFAKGGKVKGKVKGNNNILYRELDNIKELGYIENKVNNNRELGYIKELGNKENNLERGRFTPPTVDEVRAYCTERKNGIDPEQFVDFYKSKGWVIGKNRNPMVDWKAAVRTWEGRRKAERKADEEGDEDAWLNATTTEMYIH